MYPPQYVAVCTYWDHNTESWETRVFSKQSDAFIHVALQKHISEVTIKQARFVL